MGIYLILGIIVCLSPILFILGYKHRRGVYDKKISMIEAGALLLALCAAIIIFFSSRISVSNAIVEFAGTVAYLECFFFGLCEYISKRKKSPDKPSVFYLLFYSLFPILEIIILLQTVEADDRISIPGAIVTAMAVLVGVAGDIAVINFLIMQNSREYLSKRSAEINKLKNNQDELTMKAATDTDIVKSYLEAYKAGILQIYEHIKSGETETAKKILLDDFDAMTSKNEDVICNNSYISAILSAKKRICIQNGITTEFEIKLPDNLKIDSIDLCTILGNIMDNAINGCIASRIEEKSIQLSIEMQEEYLVISEFNSADKYSQIPDRHRKHYGKKIISDYVEHYSGAVEFEWIKLTNQYSVFIMMVNREGGYVLH